MSLDDRTAQEKLTPDERRMLLRALADRMLLKVSAMDDPKDLPGVEKTVRVAASIERIYYRCDRAEHHTPDPRKLEAERATNKSEAIKARVHLAGTLKWGEARRQDLGKWWDAAETTTLPPVPAPVVIPATAPQPAPQTPPQTPAAQGAALYECRPAMFETASQAYPTPDRLLKVRAAVERGDISEDQLDDFDEELDDWLQDRPPPS